MAHKVTKVIVVEGIIASGKTTLLSKLKMRFPNYQMKFVPEPIASWENTTKFKPTPNHFCNYNKLFTENDGIINCDNSKQQQFELLSQMYNDSERWCFSFQLWALYTRIKSIESTICEINGNGQSQEQHIDFLLIERSAMANRIFAEIMYDNNYLNECEWLMYNHLFDYFNQKSQYLLDGIIHLNCPINIAMNRINIRNRKGEDNITNEYQIGLENKHNKWLSNCSLPLFKIDIPYDNDIQMENNMFKNISDFMANIKSNDSRNVSTCLGTLSNVLY
eukprot:36646_1